jgi:methyl-accepting chemotaxis protein
VPGPDPAGTLAALDRSQAVAEFALDGTVLAANDNFLRTLGYTLPEVVGRHHSVFVTPAERQSREYAELWAALARGEFRAGEFERVGKGGREVWIAGAYNPVLDARGRPYKVVKFVTELTAKIQFQRAVQALMAEVLNNANALTGASQQLTTVSQQLATNAEDTAAQAGVASGAAEHVSEHLSTVAAGTEQMGASIKEIAKSANEAAKVATAAVKVADRTNATIAKLGESSAEIGNVVKVITGIAQQTNLLA